MRTARLTRGRPGAARGRLGAAAAAVAGITSAVTMFALDPAPVSAATSHNWAAGVTGITGVDIPPTPYVASDGPRVTNSAGSLPSNPVLTASLLPVTAGAGYAQAAVASLNIGGGQITADLLKATCQNGAGNADLGGLTIAGQQQQASVPPNTTVSVPPPSPFPSVQIDSVILNKQVPDGHGGLEVTALEVKLGYQPAPGAATEINATIDISTADCAAPPTSTGSTPPSAPAPTPEKGTLPVTG